jgi:formylglycine-generating enzyme required for sulfatase activity
MYYRTYTNNGSGPTGEADQATVASFSLDKYLVTVGRFRRFVAAWNNGSGWNPAGGSGKHSYLPGGGLNNGTEPGWVVQDNTNISPTNTNLGSCAVYPPTWTNSASTQENLPINCVNWWEAYAFCIWDGGFLPSEAEWEYAAAGGSQQREYPWGSMAPGTANQYAIYGCNYRTPGSSLPRAASCSVAPVGTASMGAGYYGQLDLAGDLMEWNLDWRAGYSNPCTNCANLTPASDRVVRGGDFTYPAADLLPPYRNAFSLPAGRNFGLGFRCARSP